MASELDVARERLRQQRARDGAGVGNGVTLHQTPEERLGVSLRPGDRVFDPVTGEEGYVERVSRENVIVPPAAK